MKALKKWLGIMAIFSIGLTALTSAQAAPSPRDLFIESVSPLGFTQTVEALQAEMKTQGWNVLATHDLSAALAKKGHTVLPVSIIEACSGKFSVNLLKKDETRYVSSLLPCRLSVYETSDGKVIISRMNTSAMGAQMEPAVAEVMGKAGDSVEAIIAKILAMK
ncbi:MAG TPA: DUF302 domain-containing protein [Gammaproteobacteria bacterium]